MKKETFEKIIEKVKEYNDFDTNENTVEECTKNNHWTPCDLIIREYLNNGGGSAMGFLGISATQCKNAYYYICDNKNELISKDMINENGWNNFGFSLWSNYNFNI